MSKKAELNIKEFNIDELIDSKAEYNPRTISAEQKNGLRHSIEKYGYVQNIIYNERTKTVVSGHQRLEVLKEEGYETVSVNCIDIDIEEEKKLNILMNAKTISGDFTSELNDMLKNILDTDPETFDTTSMQLLFQDMPKGEIIQADEEEDKEYYDDFDFCMKYILKHRYYVIEQRILMTGTNIDALTPGGCNTHRTEENELKSREFIKKKWKSGVSFVTNQGGNVRPTCRVDRVAKQ